MDNISIKASITPVNMQYVFTKAFLAIAIGDGDNKETTLDERSVG
jgi:hypothetical protein